MPKCYHYCFRYGKIVSTKAILDKQTNVCKGKCLGEEIWCDLVRVLMEGNTVTPCVFHVQGMGLWTLRAR